jgi:hypothetical protein
LKVSRLRIVDASAGCLGRRRHPEEKGLHHYIRHFIVNFGT